MFMVLTHAEPQIYEGFT